jgi:ATP-dependent Lon protease
MAAHPQDKPVLGAGELLPVLPLRDIVVFPHMIVPLFVGREKSVRALEAVMRDDKQILLVAQKNAAQDDPGVDDLYMVGTVSTVLQLLKLPDGTVKVLVEGVERARVESLAAGEYFVAKVNLLGDGDFVVVQGRGEAMTKRGVPYNNTYCWVYRFEGGKIKALTEYLDTELVTRAFG